MLEKNEGCACLGITGVRASVSGVEWTGDGGGGKRCEGRGGSRE